MVSGLHRLHLYYFYTWKSKWITTFMCVGVLVGSLSGYINYCANVIGGAKLFYGGANHLAELGGGGRWRDAYLHQSVCSRIFASSKSWQPLRSSQYLSISTQTPINIAKSSAVADISFSVYRIVEVNKNRFFAYQIIPLLFFMADSMSLCELQSLDGTTSSMAFGISHGAVGIHCLHSSYRPLIHIRSILQPIIDR